MNMKVTAKALEWFRTDWGFEAGDVVRVFVRYGGSSTIHEAYSLGITREEPREAAVTLTADGITFYLEADDLWYFEDRDLLIDLDEQKQEITFDVK